jgi:hypothetical protein
MLRIVVLLPPEVSVLSTLHSESRIAFFIITAEFHPAKPPLPLIHKPHRTSSRVSYPRNHTTRRHVRVDSRMRTGRDPCRSGKIRSCKFLAVCGATLTPSSYADLEIGISSSDEAFAPCFCDTLMKSRWESEEYIRGRLRAGSRVSC